MAPNDEEGNSRKRAAEADEGEQGEREEPSRNRRKLEAKQKSSDSDESTASDISTSNSGSEKSPAVSPSGLSSMEVDGVGRSSDAGSSSESPSQLSSGSSSSSELLSSIENFIAGLYGYDDPANPESLRNNIKDIYKARVAFAKLPSIKQEEKIRELRDSIKDKEWREVLELGKQGVCLPPNDDALREIRQYCNQRGEENNPSDSSTALSKEGFCREHAYVVNLAESEVKELQRLFIPKLEGEGSDLSIASPSQSPETSDTVKLIPPLVSGLLFKESIKVFEEESIKLRYKELIGDKIKFQYNCQSMSDLRIEALLITIFKIGKFLGNYNWLSVDDFETIVNYIAEKNTISTSSRKLFGVLKEFSFSFSREKLKQKHEVFTDKIKGYIEQNPIDLTTNRTNSGKNILFLDFAILYVYCRKFTPVNYYFLKLLLSGHQLLKPSDTNEIISFKKNIFDNIKMQKSIDEIITDKQSFCHLANYLFYSNVLNLIKNHEDLTMLLKANTVTLSEGRFFNISNSLASIKYVNSLHTVFLKFAVRDNIEVTNKLTYYLPINCTGRQINLQIGLLSNHPFEMLTFAENAGSYQELLNLVSKLPEDEDIQIFLNILAHKDIRDEIYQELENHNLNNFRNLEKLVILLFFVEVQRYPPALFHGLMMVDILTLYQKSSGYDGRSIKNCIKVCADNFYTIMDIQAHATSEKNLNKQDFDIEQNSILKILTLMLPMSQKGFSPASKKLCIEISEVAKDYNLPYVYYSPHSSRFPRVETSSYEKPKKQKFKKLEQNFYFLWKKCRNICDHTTNSEEDEGTEGAVGSSQNMSESEVWRLPTTLQQIDPEELKAEMLGLLKKYTDIIDVVGEAMAVENETN